MVKFYYLKFGIKFIPELSLYIKNSTIKNLKQSTSKILSNLTYRPLFQKDIIQLTSQEKKLLTPFLIRFDKREKIKATFDFSTEEVATHFQFQVKTQAILTWRKSDLKIKPGLYILPKPFPDKIVGSTSKRWLKTYNPSSARDKWIIDALKDSGPKTVLELGCGSKKRLHGLLKEAFTEINYTGIDLKAPSEEGFVTGSFVKNLPKMQGPFVSVAEEVIEHIPERSILTLLCRLRLQGATALIATTPNRDYNHFLGVKLRRSDHYFEWSEEDLMKWIKLMVKEGFKIKRFKIGKKIKGIAPTWGLIIQL